MHPQKNLRAGLTLLELMVVVAIVGILASVAIPSFDKYRNKAKLSEAYLIFSAIRTAQESYFVENNRYYSSVILDGGSVARIKNGSVKAVSGEKILINDGADFSTLGNIVSPDSLLNFVFQTAAGAFDGSGTAIPLDDDLGYDRINSTFFFPITGSTCSIPDTLGDLDATDVGVKSSPPGSYFWFVTSAVGNFASSESSECAALIQSGTYENQQRHSSIISLTQ